MPVVNGIPSDGPWFRAQGELHGSPLMIRARQDLLALITDCDLPIRVIVKWKCRAPLSLGLPSPDDYHEISAFEESVMSFLEGGAILAFVLAHDGVVEYNFYTRDSAWFVGRLNDALADKPIVPIDLTSEDDSDWTEYRSLLRRVGMDGSAA